MFASPPRHRDRGPRYDDFYTDYGREPRRMSPGPPPRRHKSEKHRRRPSPDYHSDPRSRRHGDDRRHARSPPSYTTEPRRGHTTRESGRRHTHDDYDRRPRRYDDYDDRRGGGRSRHDEPRHKVRSPPPAYEKHRSSDNRTRGRDHGDADRSHDKSTRRHRSHDNSPTRGRTSAKATKSSGATRRKSMPASSKNKGGGLGAVLSAATGGGGGGGGGQWWQNPMIQAGARTAFAAGAQAAMNNRNAQGDWLGAKGAKVATAALGAALMDGFIGGKREVSPEGRKDDGGKSSRKDSGSKGKGGGGMKEKLLSQGLNFLSNRASGRH